MCQDHRWKSTTLKTLLREVSLVLGRCHIFVRLKVVSAGLTLSSSPGEDPLTDDQNEHDINSVAGVLKLYFRGLENPLFPKERFLDFISTISESQAAKRIRSEAAVIRRGQRRENTPCALLNIPLLLMWKHIRSSTWKPSRSHRGCSALSGAALR